MGFPQLGFCDLPQQQQHAHNLTYKKKIPSHNLHLIQASNANTRRLFVSIAYCLARHREGEDKKQKTKRHKHNNKTRDTKKKRIEAIPVPKKRTFFSYFYYCSILLWRTVVVIGLFVARRPAISTVRKRRLSKSSK